MDNAILAGLMFLASFACGAQSREKIPGQNACAEEKLFVVIRSQEEWKLIRDKYLRGRAESLSEVDFSKDMVVAVFLGERRTGGWQVELKLMADPLEPRSRLIVFYREAPPPPGRAAIQMIFRPFAMRRTPRMPQVTFAYDQTMDIPESRAPRQGFFSPGNEFRILSAVNPLLGSEALFQ